MKNLTTLLKLFGIISVMLFATTACDSSDGTMEEAGEKMDNVASDIGNEVEDACEDMKEGLNSKDPNC